MTIIASKYTMFIEIPVFTDGSRVYADPLWAKDLKLHLDYILDLYLCSPTEPLSEAPDGVVAIEGLPIDHLIPLQPSFGYLSVLKTILPNFRTVARALRQTEIAHSGGAGWPFPLTFYILFLARFIPFQWIVLIESSFWMKSDQDSSPRAWLRHHIYRVLLRRSLKRAVARIFTTDNYRQFFQISPERSLIAPAVWVDEDKIISPLALEKRCAALTEEHVKFLFPARLVPEKGVNVVLAAIEALGCLPLEETPQITIDIMGEGPMLALCRDFAKAHQGKVQVRVLDMVPYPIGFFEALRDYDAIFLANRHHEQPRVVYDAFSQGVPVISSSTGGVGEIVTPEENALLFDIDDVDGLAQAIFRFAKDHSLRARMIDGACAAAQGNTHKQMHKTRAVFLKDMLEIHSP